MHRFATSLAEPASAARSTVTPDARGVARGLAPTGSSANMQMASRNSYRLRPIDIGSKSNGRSPRPGSFKMAARALSTSAVGSLLTRCSNVELVRSTVPLVSSPSNEDRLEHGKCHAGQACCRIPRRDPNMQQYCHHPIPGSRGLPSRRHGVTMSCRSFGGTNKS